MGRTETLTGLAKRLKDKGPSNKGPVSVSNERERGVGSGGGDWGGEKTYQERLGVWFPRPDDWNDDERTGSEPRGKEGPGGRSDQSETGSFKDKKVTFILIVIIVLVITLVIVKCK